MRNNAVKMGCLLLSLMMVGCASIINDKEQKINIASSNGKPIKGTIEGVPFQAPGIVSVLRENKDKVIVTETEGCAKQTSLNKSVDSVFFVNILSGGAFGSTTDYSTDKMWKYQESVTISCS